MPTPILAGAKRGRHGGMTRNDPAEAAHAHLFLARASFARTAAVTGRPCIRSAPDSSTARSKHSSRARGAHDVLVDALKMEPEW